MLEHKHAIGWSCAGVAMLLLFTWGWLMTRSADTVYDAALFGAVPTVLSDVERMPLAQIRAEVTNSGQHVDEIGGLDATLLSEAVRLGRADVAAWLLDQGADPNGIAPDYRPLESAILDGRVEIVALLIEHGADPDLPLSGRKAERTARFLAQGSDCDPEIARMVSEAKRDPTGGK